VKKRHRKGGSDLPPEEPIHLRIPVEEARRLLEDRIAKGRELLETLNQSSPAEFIRQARAWHDYNRDLIGKRLFRTDEAVAETYDPPASVAFVSFNASEQEDAYSRAKDLQTRLHRLGSLTERLELLAGDAEIEREVPRAVARGQRMRIFITWSGERSLRVAEKLHSWLPTVLPFADPWVSVENIEKGSNWPSELAKGLADTRFGIVCATPENKTEPWLLFESGALSNSVGAASRVAPLLVDVTPDELPAPVKLFQATVVSEADVRRLVRTINRVAETAGLSQEEVDAAFDKNWPDLRDTLEGIRQEPAKARAGPKAAAARAVRLPEVSDEELWILREMEFYGGRARHQMHNHRKGSGAVNSIWFGDRPVDYDESKWIYDLLHEKMQHKGFVEAKGNDFFRIRRK
jgi:TIR domain